MALVLTRLVRSNYDELDNIPIIHQDLTASFTKQADTYYIHTGSNTSAYTKGRMYYCDGTNLKKVVIVDELPAAPNNGKLTITVNGTTHTFTANQAGNTSFSITNTDTGATDVEVTGNGNAVTAASYNASTRKLTLTKGVSFQEKLTAGSNITINGNTISAKDTTYTFTASNPTLAWNTKSKIGTIGGVEFNVTMPANPNTDTATAADNILDGSNSGTQITYAPYTSQQSKLSFDSSSTEPTRSDRLNLNGHLHATKLYSGGKQVLTDHQYIGGKLDKTMYEWNKEFRAGSNGAISLGRYNIYDTQLTFDISSTTTASMSGKLVIATQNGRILQAKVFGDATGALVSKIVIYQSAIVNNRSWVEVFCNFDDWSKNKVHIYGVALESATVTNQMSSVTFTNGVPSPVTSGDSKWSGTIVNDLSGKQDKLTAGSNITISGNTISAKDTTYSFIPTNPTLAWNTAISIGTIGGVDFTVKLPANPNTHQSIKSINTNNTTAQTVSASEAITGSGTINLHKVAKTGSYKDLLNQPTIGNGKVTITVNGTAYSFTMNQTGNTSVTIKIPITAASLDENTKTLTLALA